MQVFVSLSLTAKEPKPGEKKKGSRKDTKLCFNRKKRTPVVPGLQRLRVLREDSATRRGKAAKTFGAFGGE
jgi:hypothetical protein